eukprot:CAMPEP_0197607514 /NCGR_PEP_ID=MMETSP1326-20131121/47231_1 /TAXON_ID=1155430 /ORGANISM="Genus nov. species nov., Strain RCC2288" /LENGTH=259 /DNA_ID=CAMNT_0043175583 /DNA_START=3 /DNA_END=779 /DNA_ORIENTATION=-
MATGAGPHPGIGGGPQSMQPTRAAGSGPEWGPADDEDATEDDMQLGGTTAFGNTAGGGGGFSAMTNPSFTAWRAFNDEEDEEGDGMDEGDESGEDEDGAGIVGADAAEEGTLEIIEIPATPPVTDVSTPGVATRLWSSLHRHKPLAEIFVPPLPPPQTGGNADDAINDGIGVLGCMGVSHGVHCLVVAVVDSPSSAPPPSSPAPPVTPTNAGDTQMASPTLALPPPREVSAAHVGAMQAISYVCKGKPNRRFVLATADG